jgi:hypothetical protein
MGPPWCGESVILAGIEGFSVISFSVISKKEKALPQRATKVSDVDRKGLTLT